MLQELPPNKRDPVISLVKAKLSALPPNAAPRTITHPTHKWLLPPADLQRVQYIPLQEQMVEQGVVGGEDEIVNITNLPQRVLTRITDAPPIMAAPNPTTKQALKLTKRTHSRQTRNNVPGSMPPITNANHCLIVEDPTVPPPRLCCSPQTATPIASANPLETPCPPCIP
jgi:hypothetical protein